MPALTHINLSWSSAKNLLFFFSGRCEEALRWRVRRSLIITTRDFRWNEKARQEAGERRRTLARLFNKTRVLVFYSGTAWSRRDWLIFSDEMAGIKKPFYRIDQKKRRKINTCHKEFTAPSQQSEKVKITMKPIHHISRKVGEQKENKTLYCLLWRREKQIIKLCNLGRRESERERKIRKKKDVKIRSFRNVSLKMRVMGLIKACSL